MPSTTLPAEAVSFVAVVRRAADPSIAEAISRRVPVDPGVTVGPRAVVNPGTAIGAAVVAGRREAGLGASAEAVSFAAVVRRAADPGSAEAISEAVSALRRRYGAGAVRRGAEAMPAGTWATGVPSIDEVLSPGGLPAGRVSVLAGMRRSGCRGGTGRLTLLQALLAIASRSMQVAYVDLPGSLDPGFLADLGADLDSCLVLRPPRGSVGVGLAMARTLVRAGMPWVGVALGIEGGPAAAWEHPLTALVEAVWGGRAVACVAAPAPLPAPLAYASSLTLGCSPLGWHEANGDVAGLRVRLEVAKSRVGAPGAQASLLLRYPRPHAIGDVVGLPTLLPCVGGAGESEVQVGAGLPRAGEGARGLLRGAEGAPPSQAPAAVAAG